MLLFAFKLFLSLHTILSKISLWYTCTQSLTPILIDVQDTKVIWNTVYIFVVQEILQRRGWTSAGCWAFCQSSWGKEFKTELYWKTVWKTVWYFYGEGNYHNKALGQHFFIICFTGSPTLFLWKKNKNKSTWLLFYFYLFLRLLEKS